MIPLFHKYIKGRQRRGFESKAKLQETDFRRQIRIALKAHEKRQNVDNDLLGQKGRMRFFLNTFRKKRIRPFWTTKQPGKANQRYKLVSLPIGQKGHAEKSVKSRNAGQAMEKWEPCYADGRDVNCQQPLWRSERCVLKHLKNTAYRAQGTSTHGRINWENKNQQDTGTPKFRVALWTRTSNSLHHKYPRREKNG